MDELDDRLGEEASALRARADAVAGTEESLGAVHRLARVGGHRTRLVKRVSAGLAAAAVLLLGFIVLRPRDSSPSISGAAQADLTATSALVPATITSTTRIETVPTTTAAVDPIPTTTAALPTVPITPNGRVCNYTDPGKFPMTLNVARALTCADGTAITVEGDRTDDDSGKHWLCDEIAVSGDTPCIGAGLQLVGGDGVTSDAMPMSGIKQGDTLVVGGAAPVITVPAVSVPIVVGEPTSTTPDPRVSGTVRLDGSCVLLEQSGISRVVVWPAGTQWDSRRQEIILPGGERISDGAIVDGSGGYYSLDDVPGLRPGVIDAITACLPPGSDASSADTVVLAFPATVVNPTPIVPSSTG